MSEPQTSLLVFTLPLTIAQSGPKKAQNYPKLNKLHKIKLGQHEMSDFKGF